MIIRINLHKLNDKSGKIDESLLIWKFVLFIAITNENGLIILVQIE